MRATEELLVEIKKLYGAYKASLNQEHLESLLNAIGKAELAYPNSAPTWAQFASDLRLYCDEEPGEIRQVCLEFNSMLCILSADAV